MRPLCSDSGYPAVWNFGLKDGDAVQGALKVDAFLNTLEKL